MDTYLCLTLIMGKHKMVHSKISNRINSMIEVECRLCIISKSLIQKKGNQQIVSETQFKHQSNPNIIIHKWV